MSMRSLPTKDTEILKNYNVLVYALSGIVLVEASADHKHFSLLHWMVVAVFTLSGWFPSADLGACGKR